MRVSKFYAAIYCTRIYLRGSRGIYLLEKSFRHPEGMYVTIRIKTMKCNDPPLNHPKPFLPKDYKKFT